MKNKIDVQLRSIKENKKILEVLKRNKKIALPFITIFIGRSENNSLIEYALLVNKTQFKLSVTRNKIKRQLRSILQNSNCSGGRKILFKPNSLYLKKEYKDIQQRIYKAIANTYGK